MVLLEKPNIYKALNISFNKNYLVLIYVDMYKLIPIEMIYINI